MKKLFRLLIFSLFLLALAACGGGEETAETPTDAAPSATDAPAETEAEPTAAPTGPQPVIISGSGEISATLDEFRQALGGSNNGGVPGQNATGFREINWDGAPDEMAAPNFLPGDFFNAPAEPRARGAFFSTPGEGVQVSANADNPTGTAVRFGHINPTYADIFKTFSEERLFSPVGSNIVDLTFFVPGTNTPAVVTGFGAVYTDVDTDHTAFEYFDINGNSLGQFGTPIADQGLSFLGVVFPEPIVAKVQIAYGTDALGPDDGGEIDVAVMDDFIYGEPQPIPGAVAAPAPTPTTAAPAVELLLQFQNAEAGPLSDVSLDLSALEPAPADKTYAVWLVDDGGQYALLGAAAAGQNFRYSDPDGRNLVGLYSGAALSLEAPANVTAGGLAAPTDLVASGAVPPSIVALVRQLAVAAEDTPDNKPYDPALNEQSEILATHAQLSLDAIAAGDFPVARIHLEHVNNILVGNESADFGDLNGDGDPQNPGDGFGIWPYAFRIAVVAGTIAEPGLPDYIRTAAAGIVACAANISDIWGPEAASLAREGLNAADAAAAEGPGLELNNAAKAILGGVDENGNGEIEIAIGECGALQIYQLSHQLFDIPMTADGVPPAGGGVDAQPEPAATSAPAEPAAVTVSMLDFEFDAAQITVPAGTTVTWTNDGAAPHSATAVDGSFDTALFDGGQSASIVFDAPGSFAYYCLLHGTPDGTGGMVGTVVVEP
jgi:plastocyanin